MNINKDILKTAEEIMRQQREEQDYLFKCRKACICPICGMETKIRWYPRGIVTGAGYQACTACNWRERL